MAPLYCSIPALETETLGKTATSKADPAQQQGRRSACRAGEPRSLADALLLCESLRLTAGSKKNQATLLFDERRPHDPTRASGLKPNCFRCDGQGHFVDFSSGERAPLVDRRFDAVQTLRLLGYLLHAAGYACPPLFDSLEPFAPAYGPDYRDEVCGKETP